jgi:NADH-quinone oxidoreductase subunit J
MHITQYLFYFLSFVALMCGLLVVFSKNPVYSVLYLVLTFFAIAGHYILLNAQFLAIVHLIVYAGAIMVLFLFVMMLLNLNHESEPHKSLFLKASAIIAGGCLFLLLISSLKGAENMPLNPQVDTQVGLISNLGKVLFGEFLFPFEISSVLLLGAMVGAVMIGKKEI